MLIGFYGKLGSGKDTAADRLYEMHQAVSEVHTHAYFAETFLNWSKEFVRLSFAAPLKDSAAAALGVPRDLLENYKNHADVYVGVFADYGSEWIDVKIPITVRNYLQRYGTEAHREIFGDNFWVDMTLPPDYDHSDTLTVITDVRFSNECKRVHELGGYVARIIGPSDIGASTHISEQTLSVEEYDFTINNKIRDDDFANLDRELITMMKSIIILRNYKV